MSGQLLLSIIKNIEATKGHYPGKKELQKTVYLLQKKGLNLGYFYRFHFYGPYSDALDMDIQRLNIQGLLKIRQDEYTHRIIPTERTSEQIQGEASFEGVNTNIILETIWDLQHISPLHLELMATIAFLLDNHMPSNACNEKDVIEKVHEVKKNKYKDDEICHYYQMMKEKSYIH